MRKEVWKQNILKTIYTKQRPTALTAKKSKDTNDEMIKTDK